MPTMFLRPRCTPAHRRQSAHERRRCRRVTAVLSALALGAAVLVSASPAAAQSEEEVVLPPSSYTDSDCAGKVPIVVASDGPAQSDLYSAVTLAGVLSTDCVVLAGPRGEPMPSDQLTRLETAAPDGFVVGGTAAVPDAKVAGHDLTRLAGTDRWHTARLVGAQAVISAGGADTGTVEASAGAEDPTTDCTGDEVILVASDEAAQSDLYSAVTLAGVIGTDCIIRTGPRGGDWPPDQLERARAATPHNTLIGYIVGGTAAVPQDRLEGFSYSFTRIAGDDRWQTAQRVGDRARSIALMDPAEDTDDTEPEETEEAEPPAPTYTAVSSGWNHTCALRTDSTVACWGSDEFGQSDAPEGIFTAVSAGGRHTCGLRTDGTVECWGSDEDGQSSVPSGTFTAVSAGGHHTCALRPDTSAECWGLDTDGQSTPTTSGFKTISAGDWHTCALDDWDNWFHCWGDLHGSTSGDFVQMSADNGTQLCVLHSDGTASCWGENYPNGGPSPIGTSLGPITAVSAGGDHACGIVGGAIFCWGDDSRDQVTGGTPGNAIVITDIDGNVIPFIAVSAGGFHTCGLTQDGRVRCWGADHRGQATPPTS